MGQLDYTLTSVPTLVESPFVYVTIGGYTFGMAQRKNGKQYTEVDFPNFMQSIEVTKINGEVNTYTISMQYNITPGDDPNILDHIISNAANNREMLISYGDWSHPQHIFKEEQALITNISENMNFGSSSISYTIAAVSAALNAMSQSFNFPAVTDKPSNQIMRLLKNSKYGLNTIFKGMSQLPDVVAGGLIASDDKVVKMQNKNMCNVYDYLVYLVSCMQPEGNTEASSNAFYALSISDDNQNQMGGQYFTVKKLGIASWDDKDAYELDVGYPGNNLVSGFDVQTNDQWTILYENSAKSRFNETYKINMDGVLEVEPSYSITRDKTQMITTAQDAVWWKKVTEFPIQVSLTIKGLARPTLLLQYVKLNVLFYGKRHITSGRYIITKEVDKISSSGYTTTLDMLRIKGDDPDYMNWYNK